RQRMVGPYLLQAVRALDLGRRRIDDAGRLHGGRRQAFSCPQDRCIHDGGCRTARSITARRQGCGGHRVSRISRLLPLIVFLLLLALLGFGIWWNTWHLPRQVPSPLIDKPAPAYNLPRLNAPDKTVSKADMLGKPYLVNIFASWCFACGQEHPVLM